MFCPVTKLARKYPLELKTQSFVKSGRSLTEIILFRQRKTKAPADLRST